MPEPHPDADADAERPRPQTNADASFDTLPDAYAESDSIANAGTEHARGDHFTRTVFHAPTDAESDAIPDAGAQHAADGNPKPGAERRNHSHTRA